MRLVLSVKIFFNVFYGSRIQSFQGEQSFCLRESETAMPDKGRSSSSIEP